MTDQTHREWTVNDPDCNGICISGADVGVGGDLVAYPHPACPAHRDDPTCGALGEELQRP